MATHNTKHASDLEWISNGGWFTAFCWTPEPETAVPIPVNLRWGFVHLAEDGSVHLKKNIEIDAALSGSEDGGIYEGDYDTDNEHAMYQGPLHSSRGSRYKTNKRMFVDVSKVQVGQLILVRRTDSSENPIELCKVIEREATLKIHWFGGNSLNGKQGPLSKKRPKGQTSGPKNVPYYDEIHVDSVLTDDPFDLTKSKLIPKRVLTLAMHRLQTVQSIQAEK